MCLLDENEVAFLGPVEELDHFLVSKLNTACAGERADFVLVIGAVEIDVALVGVATGALVVPRFQSFQPKDAGSDEVFLLLRFWQIPVAFADVDASFENGPDKGAVADLFGDSVEAGGRAEGVFDAGRRVFAGGDDVATELLAGFEAV